MPTKSFLTILWHVCIKPNIKSPISQNYKNSTQSTLEYLFPYKVEPVYKESHIKDLFLTHLTKTTFPTAPTLG